MSWGDYTAEEVEGEDGKSSSVWQRHPREQTVDVSLGAGGGAPWVVPLPDSGGLELSIVERAVSVVDLEGQIPAGTRSISLFLVNHRPPLEARLDEAFVFQPQLNVQCEVPFVPRPDLRGASPEDWDEQVADLHYADVPAYATGHSVFGGVGSGGRRVSPPAHRLDPQCRSREDQHCRASRRRTVNERPRSLGGWPRR